MEPNPTPPETVVVPEEEVEGKALAREVIALVLVLVGLAGSVSAVYLIWGDAYALLIGSILLLTLGIFLGWE